MPYASIITRTTRRAAGAALLAAATVAAVSVAHAPAKASRSQTAPVSFLVKQESFAAPDPAFPKAGDTIVVQQKNVQNGRVIGHDSTGCIVTNAAGLLQCTATVVLPGGVFEVAFPELPGAKNITAPITAGTGRYAGTRGYFSLHSLSSTEYRATLHTP
jgi:hypothetical protein